MSAKLAEGVKKGAPPPALDPATFDFSEAFVAALPVPLVRQCVARRLAACPHAKTKGYVLDVWGVPGVVASVEDFCELVNVPPPPPPPPSPPLPSEGADSSSEPTTTTTTATTAAAATAGGTDLVVVEIESGDRAALVDRFAQSLGVSEADNKAKLPKETQAALKAFDARLDAYWPKLRDVPREGPPGGPPGGDEVAGGAEQAPPATRLGHGALHDACDALALRVGTVGAEHQGDAAAAAAHIVAFIVARVHGEVGWLAPRPTAPSSGDRRDGAGGDSGGDGPVGPGASYEWPMTTATMTSPPAAVAVAAGADAGDGDDLAPINRQLSGLGEGERQGLVASCADLLEYLEVNVTPFLARCLVDIERQKPTDPVAFMIAFLEEQSAKNQAEAQAHAHANFVAELEEAEKRYQQEANAVKE